MSTTLFVAGRGEALEATRSRFTVPALTAIRYADPAAWITATAVANALDPVRDAVAAAHDRVGVVVTSADGPVEAMAAMCEASRGGSSSPIRFPASNAGSLAGLTSIAFGLRGPTLMLTLPADRGVPVGLLLAEAWLKRGVASFVVVASCGRRDGRPVARCLLLGDAGSPFERDRDAAWLAALPAGHDGGSAPKPPAAGHDGGSAPKPPAAAGHDGGSAPKPPAAGHDGGSAPKPPAAALP